MPEEAGGSGKVSEEKEVRKVAKRLEDGTVVKGSGEAIYIIDGGKKRLIPDVFTYISLGINAAEILHLDDKDLDAIGTGDPIPEIAPKGKTSKATEKLAQQIKTLG